MYTLLKSEIGSFPEPQFPTGIDLRAEDRKARRRLYPVTVIYSVQLFILLTFAVRSGQALAAFGFVALGMLTWIPTEWLSHRYILHGVFPKRGGPLRHALHYLFDATHADHHARPWDGMYINGHVDTLWVALVLVPLSFLAPSHTAPVWVATVFLCYATEEWVHHAMHFWSFRSAYFRYIRARHLYHHSRPGAGLAYGVTSAIWDVVSGTRIPAPARRRLVSWRGAHSGSADQGFAGRSG
jgi:sterol desaturase/sphingolipid hydroxylase (fatty acid hydroxylase superfamily)